MKTRPAYLAAALLVLAVSVFAEDRPAVLKSEAGGFEITPPFELEESTQAIDVPGGGQIVNHKFVGEKGAKTCLVGYNDYPAVDADRAEQMLEAIRDGGVRSVHGELKSDLKITLDGHPGREFVVEAQTAGVEYTFKWRIFLVKERLYRICFTQTAKGAATEDEINAFLTSFKLLKKEDPRVTAILEELRQFEALKEAGKYADALPHQLKVVEGIKDVYGENNQAFAVQLNNLAATYDSLAQYADAEPYYQRSLAIHEKLSGPNDPDIASSLNNLALLYFNMGQYEKAEPLYQRCLRIDDTQLGPEHPDTATALNNLALLYKAMGQYGKAEPLDLRALAIREKKLGPDHADIAQSLNNLAELYLSMGQYEKAEPLFQRALIINEKCLGPEHPDTATSINNLAELYRYLGQYALVIPLYQRVLAIYEKQLGPNHPDTAHALNNLGLAYFQMGRYTDAEPYYLSAQRIFETRLGPTHAFTAQNLENLATLYFAMGQYQKAEPLFERALKIDEKLLGLEHPDTATIVNSLAALYAATGEGDKALEAFQRARRSASRHIQRTLPMLSELEQRRFLSNQESANWHGALTLALQNPGRASLTAPWLFNGKALALACQAERAQFARETKDPATRELASKLGEIRAHLARAVMSAPPPGQEHARFERINELDAQEDLAAKALGTVQGRLVRPDPWVTLENVQTALPADALLIDIARFPLFDFKAKGQEERLKAAHYAAWITFPADAKQPVVVVDLGAAEKIDAAVAAFRAVAEDTHSNAVQEKLKAVAELVLKPLEEHISGTPRWWISPDAGLWLVPWAALPTTTGELAIEKHEIGYLISAREWVESGYTVETTAPAILADPDFDGTGKQVPAADTPSAQTAQVFSRSASLNGAQFPPLPGTAREAHAILGPLAALTKAAPIVWMGADANKANFHTLQRPKVVVLSTHGFFLADQEGVKDPLTREFKPNPAAENPLLRCGLALAGANHREPLPNGGDNGILSGLEIVSTDLRGTDLVVLSACETGIGVVNNGEGVAGLRQCFQLAGANAVMATLWHVNDASSATLMTDFFNNLAAGQRKAEALRNAQLKFIKAMHGAGQTPHPYFWAPYTLTGR